MRKEREELRRGLRSFIEDASVELAEFTKSTPGPTLSSPPKPLREPAPPERPILRLVREAQPAPADVDKPVLEEMTLHLPKKGVCAAYYVNKRCWELPDAFCNQALHICRLRECPVYDLHREEMEGRFAAKFRHLW